MTSKPDKEKLLKKSKHFCMLPWVHMHLLPSSSILPCCVWPYNEPIGNLKDSSLKEVWNNEEYKSLRLKMLTDEAVTNCNQCYERDSANGLSLRRGSNIEWAHLFEEIVEPTIEDGELKQFHMSLFDVRFSNICNFKCRGCSPELSSSWLSDHEKLYDYKSNKDKLISIMPNEHAWRDLLELLPTVEKAYFAGGEPLIMDEHYLILEELIKLDKSNVQLSYNSNMSNLRFRDKSVTDYWNKFKRVAVGVSIDDFGARGEFFRHGMDWKKTIENINLVKERCPHVIFSINCTVSLFNVYYLAELHSEALRLGIIQVGDFFANLLVDPVEYRVQVLPKDFRLKAAKKLKDYLKVIYEKHAATDPFGCEKLKFSLQSVINYLSQEDQRSDQSRFREITNKLDSIRKESFSTVYPEMAFLLDQDS